MGGWEIDVENQEGVKIQVHEYSLGFSIKVLHELKLVTHIRVFKWEQWIPTIEVSEPPLLYS